MHSSNDKSENNHEKTFISVLIPKDRLSPSSVPYLFRLIDSERPLAPSARHLLDGIDEITVGRATQDRCERSDSRLRLTAADPWMSSNHALIREVVGTWMLEDVGSSNGTRVNGIPIERPHRLSDGDLIEIGHTFFLFRTAGPPPDSQPPDLNASSLKQDPPGLATLSPAFARDLERLEHIAPSMVSVILHGETGSGKEVLANAVHRLSGRGGEIAALNCGAIPASLVEAELFGSRKGAYSGSIEDRKGLIRTADGGTLFLDEIGELPPPAQVAFLRALQEHVVVPVGGTRPIQVDFRLCAATHCDLEELVAGGRFRADLLARLTGFKLRLPPMRERREDFGLLTASLLRRLAGDRADQVRFTRDALRALLTYAWSLNIRELAKVLEAALVLARNRPIDLEHLPEAVRRPKPLSTSSTSDSEEEEDTPLRTELRKLLEDTDGNLSAVARIMGKDRVQIRRWLRKCKLNPELFRKNGKNNKKADDDDD